MTARRLVAAGIAAALTLAPRAAHACAVCFDAKDANRAAFLGTTIFLSLLPLGMVAGLALWLRRKARAMDEGTEGREQMADSR